MLEKLRDDSKRGPIHKTALVIRKVKLLENRGFCKLFGAVSARYNFLHNKNWVKWNLWVECWRRTSANYGVEYGKYIIAIAFDKKEKERRNSCIGYVDCLSNEVFNYVFIYSVFLMHLYWAHYIHINDSDLFHAVHF